MSVSIVIPIAGNGFGSQWADQELRFMLRGVEKHLTNYGEIFIIGSCPSWVKNVTVIPAPDSEMTYHKERNIFNKVMVACKDQRVTEDFLFMNDDHFLLKDYEADKFPNYLYQTLADQLVRQDQYGNTVANTVKHVSEYWPYFDVHCPILYNKSFFRKLATYDWNKKYGYCIKTLYMAQGQEFPAVEHVDVKINEALSSRQIENKIQGLHWFSMGNRAKEGGIGKVLQELYPNKSRVER